MTTLINNIKQRFSRSNIRIMRGMLFVSGFMLVGKLVAAFKEMGIAYRYGVGDVVDVYVLAFVLISWLPLIATGILQSVLVPILNRMSLVEQKEFSAQLTGCLFLMATLASLLVLFLFPMFAPQIAHGFAPEALEGLKYSLKFLTPCILLLTLVALYSAELLARERHANTLLEAIPAFTLLIFVLLWPNSGSVYLPLLWGTLIGLALQAVGLLMVMNTAGIKFGFSLQFNHHAWHEFRRSVSVLIISAIAISFITPIDQFLAARLGEGSVSSLSYAIRLLALAIGLGVTVISRALLPVLSDSTHTTQEKLVLAKQWAKWTLLLGLLAALLAYWLAPWGVSLLFERGAFKADNTQIVTAVFRTGLLQLPFLFSGMVFVQLFASMGEYQRIAQSGFVMVVVKLFSGAFLTYYLGVPGIMLSTALMYLATFAFFWFSLYRYQEK